MKISMIPGGIEPVKKILDLRKMKIVLPEPEVEAPRAEPKPAEPIVKIIKTHASDSPVCKYCKKKGPDWFERFPQCEETGKEPSWKTEEITIEPITTLHVNLPQSGGARGTR